MARPDDDERAAVAQDLGGELAELRRRLEALGRHLKGVKAQGGDRKVLASLGANLRRARALAASADAALANGALGDATAHLLQLNEALRDGIAHRDNVDEIDREIDDADPEGRPAWERVRDEVEGVVAAAGRMTEHLTALSHAQASNGAATMDETSNETAEAVREVGITLAGMLGHGMGGVVVPRSGLGGGLGTALARAPRRAEVVGDQMVATLDALGLPHDGLHLGRGEGDAGARARLLDALNRNFAARDRDGYRIYARSAPPPVVREPSGASKLLRGGALVQANLLRAEADALLGIIDRLPSAARFQPALPHGGAAREARRAIGAELDNLVGTASDPMGLNRSRAHFVFLRLVVAVIDYLDAAEVMPQPRRPRGDGGGFDATIRWLTEIRRDEIGAEGSVVRDEEVRAELLNLVDLLVAMGRRLADRRPDERRGHAAARLEETLTAALGAADALVASLERWGTDLMEQEVQDMDGDEDGRMSIGQWVRWVRAVAEPFAEATHAAAALRQAEADVLTFELRRLAEIGGRFAQELAAGGLRRSAPRAQMVELAGYLQSAAADAEQLSGLAGRAPDDRDATDAPGALDASA